VDSTNKYEMLSTWLTADTLVHRQIVEVTKAESKKRRTTQRRMGQNAE
jgi:hypothetical protein